MSFTSVVRNSVQAAVMAYQEIKLTGHGCDLTQTTWLAFVLSAEGINHYILQTLYPVVIQRCQNFHSVLNEREILSHLSL